MRGQPALKIGGAKPNARTAIDGVGLQVAAVDGATQCHDVKTAVRGRTFGIEPHGVSGHDAPPVLRRSPLQSRSAIARLGDEPTCRAWSAHRVRSGASPIANWRRNLTTAPA